MVPFILSAIVFGALVTLKYSLRLSNERKYRNLAAFDLYAYAPTMGAVPALQFVGDTGNYLQFFSDSGIILNRTLPEFDWLPL
jgi:hypothetical protein